jgi:hypothetical protein
MVDAETRSEIDKLVERLLRDAACEPPVQLDVVLRHLEVDLDYYDLEDPSLIRRFVHRAKVRGQRISNQIREIARRVKLHALWCPDDSQIFVDRSLPAPKQKWAAYHDASHRLLPWHREFYCWETAQTLDPTYQEMLESEANYGGSALMFCGERFTREALDTVPNWESVRMLSRRHHASLTATLRRYVRHGHDRPMVAVVSTPRWLPVADGGAVRHRYVDPSLRFVREFGRIAPEVLGAIVDANTGFARGGPVGDFTCMLIDLRGVRREFRVECFFNRHDLLTLFVERWRTTGTTAAPAKRRNGISILTKGRSRLT